ncbi:MAG: alpha-L-fucosidase, partial [Phycicoccus sp.]
MTSTGPHHGLRQIHLDFHTSRDFTRIAEHFDGSAFAETMAAAAVTGVNVFAKCHHGFSYYPTEVGTVHPGLSRDLLGEQIAALHERGIDAPVYVSVMWDDHAAEQHPEWVVTDRAGHQMVREPLSPDSPLENRRGWSTMDLASGYGEHVLAQLAELLDRYPVDGLWLDIVWVEPNYSPAAQLRMRRDGVDLSDDAAVYTYARAALLAWMGEVHRLLAARAPAATVFFNGMTDA